MKIYNDKMYRNFQNNKIPKDNGYIPFSTVLLLDSILVNLDKKYYPQIFL